MSNNEQQEQLVIKTWRERLPEGVGISYDYAHVCAMKAEIADLRAALTAGAAKGGADIGKSDKSAAQNAEAIRNQALNFADEIINGAFDGGDWGGGDVQELAVKHGLLKVETMAEPCGEGCRCAQGVPFFPAECYRKTYIRALQSGTATSKTGRSE